jgi:ParB-like chromosome segregation protein Spo0J
MIPNGSGPTLDGAVEDGARDVDQLASEIASEIKAFGDANQDHLKFHPLASLFPLMEGAEFDELVADIKANGLLEDIVLYEGMILDGRNRYRACLAAGRKVYTSDFSDVTLIDDPATFVISRNIHRRHLTAEQKRELIAKLIKAQPENSDRQIAVTAKASPTTVGTVRAKMEAAGDVSKLDTRTDKRGRKQPSTKVKVKPEELVAAAAEIGIPEAVIKTHGPQNAEAIRRIVQRKKRDRAKKEREIMAVEPERLASKLIKLDRGTAHALQQLLSDRDIDSIDRLEQALARGLDDGIPECLRRAPKTVAP